MALRPTTNLVVPQHLMLPKKALKEKFLYVYTGAYVGTPTAFMTKLWASVLFPSVTSDPNFGKVRPRQAADQLAKATASGYLRVKKVMDQANPHYVVSVPLFTYVRHNPAAPLQFLRSFLLGYAHSKKTPPDPKADTLDEQRNFAEQMGQIAKDQIHDEIIPAQKVISAMKLDSMGDHALKNSLINVRIQTKGNLVVIFATFKITKEEVQQLTTTEWIELRDIDLYPLLLHWVTVGFGARGLAPVAAFPVSKIAFTLPPNHSDAARVNEWGLSINPEGKPVFLPKKVDKQQTIAYEDKYANAGSREDGSFALHDINEGATMMESGQEVKVKLPVNMVISVDWLNNKYAYTGYNGMLQVEDLTRFRTANSSHIRALLDYRVMTEDYLKMFMAMGQAAGVAPSEFQPLAKDVDGLDSNYAVAMQRAEKDPVEWFKVASNAYRAFLEAKPTDNVIVFSVVQTNGFGAFAPIARYLKRIEAAVRDNIETVYLKYSVSTVMAYFAWLTMIVHYADDIAVVRADDERLRKPATTQSVDPNWKMPSVPLIKKDMGLLPHQLKVQNLMKDDPDVAIMPIQTGGGKTPSLLVDLLLRFKENISAPYLVLCPSHLVPNYVKEAVYFTDGKLNVIALSNTAIRQNGWKRLQAIFEAMPRNTVVVVDLDYSLAYRARAVSYGTTPTVVFPVIDFLRQFNFGYVAIDEAHRIKGKSSRNKSVMALISDIPKKRLASGTFVHDSPSDLARIIGALDPTIFGSREEFNNTYGEIVRGDRVVKWREGAERQIMQRIKEHVVVAGAMRKEWAAFLPKKVEWIGSVNLTSAQQAVYEDILNETIEQIEENAKTNVELRKFLEKKSGGSPTGEGPEESAEEAEEGEREIDEDEGEDMAKLLNPYLARLESFLIAPGRDVLGKQVLKGEDLLSPKVALVYERIRLHLQGGKVKTKDGEAQYGPFQGKILVFCNYDNDAQEIFDKAPPDLKKSGLLYRASDKVEHLAQMEKNPNMKWMVGIVKSMEEGLNLQFASRIIRVSSPWNPGSLEQSNARIERPEFKKEEIRTRIFFDSIVANHTYDITKQARLIAKVVAAAKFENAENAEYGTIPDLKIVPMNLDTIRTFNTWQYLNDENPGLLEYAQALAKYETVRNDDYEAYKENYIAKHGAGPVMTGIDVAPTPPDSKLLKVTPYVPGLGLYNEREMGLVRVDEFLNVVSTEEDEGPGGDESDEGDDEGEDQGNGIDPELKEKLQGLKNQLVHTEYGEGYIKHVSAKSKFITVELVNGYRIRVWRSQVFLVTRSLTSNKDIRNQILKSIGKMPLSVPVDVPAEKWKPSKKGLEIQQQQEEQEQVVQEKTRKTQQQKALNVELTMFIANGFLGLDYVIDEQNTTAMKVLQAHGFRSTPEYYYSRVPNHNALNNQMKMWKDEGLTADPVVVKQGVFEAFQEMYNLLKTGKIKNHMDTYKATSVNKVVNFYRLEHKPSNKKELFKPYPIIQDGAAYIALPTGQAGTREAMRLKRPAFKWLKSDPTLSFFGTPQQIAHALKAMQDAGLNISNIEDLRKEFARVKVMKVRDPNEGGVPS